MEFKQAEKMDWQEEFKRMKRWYHRIEKGLDSDREDFLIAFLQCCYHFNYWLIKDGIATGKEVNDYINNNAALKLCADVCNFSKHGNSKKNPRTDPDTQIIGQKVLFMPPVGSSYNISVLKITNGGSERYDAFQIGKDCMDAWAHFLISKKLQIPILMQEVIFQNAEPWQPTWKAPDDETLKAQKQKIEEIIQKVNSLEVGLYKNPADEELFTAFKLLSSGHQGVEQNVINRAQSAREKKIKIDPESAKHSVTITNITILGTIGDIAAVETQESSYWKWSSGYVFTQNKRPHTYKLSRFGEYWKVIKEDLSAWISHSGI